MTIYNIFKKNITFLIMTKHKAYTLVELLIVVALIGIITSIAYSSYAEQIRKSRLVDLKKELSSMTTNIEQAFFRESKFPNKNAVILPKSNYFDIKYEVGSSNSSYIIWGEGKSGTDVSNMWAAVNNQLTQCFCINCQSKPVLNFNDKLCPTGTEDW